MKRLAFLFALILSACSWDPQLDDVGDLLDQLTGSPNAECTRDTSASASTATTLDAEAASGQKVVPLTATTNMAAGDVVVLEPTSSTNKEVCIIASVSAGVSITCVDNLAITHANGVAAQLTNRLPATGTAGFTVGQRYRLFVYASGSLVAGNCMVGDRYVSGVQTSGTFIPPLFGTATPVVFRPGKQFISCIPASAATVELCPLN